MNLSEKDQKDQVDAAKNTGIPSSESKATVKLDASDDPLNSVLLLLYELSIANAPVPPADCRDIAEKIAVHVGTARALLAKQKDRVSAFQQGYKDESFKVTALEIQLMDCRAYGADKVTARNNESLRAKLYAACIERNELRESHAALYEAAQGALRTLKTSASIMSDGRNDIAKEQLRAALALADGQATGGFPSQ